MKNHSVDPFIDKKVVTQKDIEYKHKLDNFYSESLGSNYEKLHNFTKYVPTKELRKFLYRYEIFKKILNIHGSIIEAGVLYGGGLMTWAHLSEIFEPLNHLRKIIGFDTFKGFPKISSKDNQLVSEYAREGGYAVESFDDISRCIDLFQDNTFLNHINKVEIIKGDICTILPKYINDNPHLIVSLLHLDLDIYEPTKIMLKYIVPRMPKGGIIVFDELNMKAWPGETIALIEEIGINKLRIERLAFGTTLSFATIE
jgi:hypothetical protein